MSPDRPRLFVGHHEAPSFQKILLYMQHGQPRVYLPARMVGQFALQLVLVSLIVAWSNNGGLPSR